MSNYIDFYTYLVQNVRNPLLIPILNELKISRKKLFTPLDESDDLALFKQYKNFIKDVYISHEKAKLIKSDQYFIKNAVSNLVLYMFINMLLKKSDEEIVFSYKKVADNLNKCKNFSDIANITLRVSCKALQDLDFDIEQEYKDDL